MNPLDQIYEEDHVGVIIELIQNYQFLIDLKHKDYKNNLKKDEAWREISTILNISAEECKRLWKYARDRFTREKRQLPKGSGPEQCSWKYYGSMLFYNQFTKPRKRYSRNMTIKQPPATTNTMVSASPSPPMWAGMQSDSDTDASNIEAEEKYAPETTNIRTISMPASAQKRTRVDSESEADSEIRKLVEVAKKIAYSCEQINLRHESQGSSTNHKFVEYVYTRLNDMDEKDAKKARRAIGILLEN